MTYTTGVPTYTTGETVTYTNGPVYTTGGYTTGGYTTGGFSGSGIHGGETVTYTNYVSGNSGARNASYGGDVVTYTTNYVEEGKK